MLVKEIIQHAADEFGKWCKKNYTRERCKKEIRNNES